MIIVSHKNSDLFPFPSVGGHAGVLCSEKTRQLFKPLLDARGKREVEFYSKVTNDQNYIGNEGASAGVSPFLGLSSFIPRFFGTAIIDDPEVVSPSNSPQKGYIVLENLVDSMIHPSVMDVKVGLRTYGNMATAEKAAAEEKKYPLQRVTGYRIVGMRVCNGSLICEYGRNFGLSFTDPDTAHKGFEVYFGEMQGILRVELAKLFLQRLRIIEKWFLEQREFLFFGSSLLFIYDVHQGGTNSLKVDVRLIDFAHTEESKGVRDEGFLVGLQNICKAFEIIISETKI